MSTAHTTGTTSRSRLSGCCSRPIPIGLPGSTSWSLPNAISEPQNDTDPTIAANSDVTATYPATPWYPCVELNSTQEISATAPPPTPLNRATICGIAVILTCRAAGTPTTAPVTRPTAISHQ